MVRPSGPSLALALALGACAHAPPPGPSVALPAPTAARQSGFLSERLLIHVDHPSFARANSEPETDPKVGDAALELFVRSLARYGVRTSTADPTLELRLAVRTAYVWNTACHLRKSADEVAAERAGLVVGNILMGMLLPLALIAGRGSGLGGGFGGGVDPFKDVSCPTGDVVVFLEARRPGARDFTWIAQLQGTAQDRTAERALARAAHDAALDLLEDRVVLEKLVWGPAEVKPVQQPGPVRRPVNPR